MSEVYDFVFENIFDKKREFYLYEQPPKKIFNKMDETIYKLNLLPSAKIFFGWKDEEAGPGKSEYVLDVQTL